MGNGIDEKVINELLLIVKEIQETKVSKDRASIYELNRQLELAIVKLEADSKTTQDIIVIVKENLPIFTDQKHIQELVIKCQESSIKDIEKAIEEFGKELKSKFVNTIKREIKLFFSPLKIFAFIITCSVVIFTATFSGIWYTSSVLSKLETKVNAIELSHKPTGHIGQRLTDLEDIDNTNIENEKNIQRRLIKIETYMDNEL